MIEVRFLGTSNEERLNPDAAFVEDKLRNAGPAYWRHEKLTAELVVVRPGPAEQITLMVEEPYGVFVHYCSRDGAEELLLHNPGEPHPEDGVALYPGGAEWVVPRANLLPIDLAMKAIAHFLGSGEPRRDLSWTRLSPSDMAEQTVPEALDRELSAVEASLEGESPSGSTSTMKGS